MAAVVCVSVGGVAVFVCGEGAGGGEGLPGFPAGFWGAETNAGTGAAVATAAAAAGSDPGVGAATDCGEDMPPIPTGCDCAGGARQTALASGVSC